MRLLELAAKVFNLKCTVAQIVFEDGAFLRKAQNLTQPWAPDSDTHQALELARLMRRRFEIQGEIFSESHFLFNDRKVSEAIRNAVCEVAAQQGAAL